MRLLVSTAAVPAWRRSLTAVSALWVSALRLFVATRTALVTALVTSLTVAAVLRWRTTVGTCLLLTSETTWLLAAMRLLSEVTTCRVV